MGVIIAIISTLFSFGIVGCVVLSQSDNTLVLLLSAILVMASYSLMTLFILGLYVEYEARSNNHRDR